MKHDESKQQIYNGADIPPACTKGNLEATE